MIHGQSRNRQQGITLLGFLIVGAFIGLFVLAGIKLVPVYMEFTRKFSRPSRRCATNTKARSRASRRSG